jgi:hypothetical protein
MWDWLVFLGMIAGGILFAIYILTNIVIGIVGVFDFLRFYYRLFGGTISIQQMRDEIKGKK